MRPSGVILFAAIALASACAPQAMAADAKTSGWAFVTVRPGQKEVLDPSAAILKRAAQVTTGMTEGAQIVTLPWRAHETSIIPVRPGMFVTFSFPKNDTIQQFAVANPDAVQLNVNAAANVAMLKLNEPIATVATVVTSSRIFYLRIVPAQEGPWYQGVSWSVDGGGLGTSDFGALYTAPTVGQSIAPTGGGASSAPSLFTGEPNFSYVISGAAPFKPVAVWDNGRFTWIQFRSGLQELPALFADGPNGLQVVNYTTHNNGTQILVNRLMSKFVLRLGKEEVVVTAQGER